MSTTIVLNQGEGEILGGGSFQLRFLAQSPDQQIAITDNVVPPAYPGPVRHRHEVMTDIFYVLEGTLLLELDGEHRSLTAGGFALVPPGVVHTFSNPDDVPARFLNIYQPAGNEHYLKEVGQRLAAGQAPTPAEMAAIARRYDFVPVVP